MQKACICSKEEKKLDSAHSDIFLREYICKVFNIKTELQQGIVTQNIWKQCT